MFDEIKEYLSRYYYLSLKVESLEEELKYLEILATGTQGCSFDEPRVQKTPSLKAPFLKYIDKIDKKRNQINEKIEELLRVKDEIQCAISTVDDPIMELVLTYRYINCLDWNEVAKKMNYAESYIFKLHRKALERVKYR